MTKNSRHRRFTENMEILKRKGIKYESKNNGFHLIVEGRFDFWPSTGRWAERPRPLTAADPITGMKLKQGESIEELLFHLNHKPAVIIGKNNPEGATNISRIETALSMIRGIIDDKEKVAYKAGYDKGYTDRGKVLIDTSDMARVCQGATKIVTD